MATYDNSYQMKVTPNKPGIRGIEDNYDNSGQVNQSGYGLGDIYQLDYDRNKIEQIFNQGTDAQYALMQKENQIAQNQYANNQFANQQSAIETLRQQRNNQIASGMARGLNAAQEQGTVLGLQQEAASGALELANQQQLEADKIAAEYANNVAKALQESNSVKQAMAQVAAQMYEADMLGYTGELSYAGQMDANASDRYGYDVGYEGTKYQADKNYDATVYNANMNYEGTKYAADQNRAAQENAARIQAAATRAVASASGKSESEVQTAAEKALEWAKEHNPNPNDPNSIVNTAYNYMRANGFEDAEGALWDNLDAMAVAGYGKDQTKKAWEKSQKEQQNNKTTTKTNTNSTKTGNTIPAHLKGHPDLQQAYGYTQANGYIDAQV